MCIYSRAQKWYFLYYIVRSVMAKSVNICGNVVFMGETQHWEAFLFTAQISLTAKDFCSLYAINNPKSNTDIMIEDC